MVERELVVEEKWCRRRGGVGCGNKELELRGLK
jgi:hypothetical protein